MTDAFAALDDVLSEGQRLLQFALLQPTPPSRCDHAAAASAGKTEAGTDAQGMMRGNWSVRLNKRNP